MSKEKPPLSLTPTATSCLNPTHSSGSPEIPPRQPYFLWRRPFTWVSPWRSLGAPHPFCLTITHHNCNCAGIYLYGCLFHVCLSLQTEKLLRDRNWVWALIADLSVWRAAVTWQIYPTNAQTKQIHQVLLHKGFCFLEHWSISEPQSTLSSKCKYSGILPFTSYTVSEKSDGTQTRLLTFILPREYLFWKGYFNPKKYKTMIPNENFE